MLYRLRNLLGIEDTKTSVQERIHSFAYDRIRTLNIIALLASGVAALSIPMAILQKKWLLLPGSILLIAAMLAIIHLQKKGRYHTASMMMALTCIIVITGQCIWLGPEFGVHYWYLPLTLFPFVFFPSTSRHTPTLLASLSVILFYTAARIDLQHHSLPKDYFHTEILASLFIWMLGFTFRRYLIRSETRVSKHQQNMKQYTNQLSSLNSTLAQKVESEERNRIQMDKEVRGRVEAQQYFIEHMTRIAGLTQLSQSASEQTTERGLIHACTQVAHRITGADHIEIILRDESGLRFQKIEIDSPDNVNKSSWVSGNDIPWIDEVLTKGRLVAQDTAAENPAWTIDLGKNDTKSAMATPLMASGTLLGVIRVGSKFSNHFDRATQNLVYKFAATVSTNLALLRSLQGLENEIDRADAVLISVLPPSVSRRLKDGETGIAERIDLAGVFFCDLAGFTTYSAKVEPEVVVEMLQGAFAVLEEKCVEHNVEKIKTIGDAFMAVAGVSLPVHDAILTITEFALDAGEALKRHFNQMGLPLGFRIGIHAGPVLAGVIGQERLFFDVWGDAVNLASRLEASGTTSEVRCSDKIQTHLHEHFNFEDCGLLELKGKGSQRVWKIQRTKSTSR